MASSKPGCNHFATDYRRTSEWYDLLGGDQSSDCKWNRHNLRTDIWHAVHDAGCTFNIVYCPKWHKPDGELLRS